MSKYAERLWQDLVREHAPDLALAVRPGPSRARVLGRPRVLAGGTLGLAGVAAALTLALTGGTPAFAVTTNADGTVLVTLNQQTAVPQANAKLAAMGTREQLSIQMASGPAAVNGAVTCTPSAGVSGPPVQVLVGADGTEVIASTNTGAGTWHLGACFVTDSGNGGTATGNSGSTTNR